MELPNVVDASKNYLSGQRFKLDSFAVGVGGLYGSLEAHDSGLGYAIGVAALATPPVIRFFYEMKRAYHNTREDQAARDKASKINAGLTSLIYGCMWSGVSWLETVSAATFALNYF